MFTKQSKITTVSLQTSNVYKTKHKQLEKQNGQKWKNKTRHVYILFTFYYVTFYITFIFLLNVYYNIICSLNVNLIGHLMPRFYNVECV